MKVKSRLAHNHILDTISRHLKKQKLIVMTWGLFGALQHSFTNAHNNISHTLFRFMVGCGRCDDWFHGDCVGLDLAKVREMEEEDQMYVCLKCCEEESKKVEAEPPSAAKTEGQTTAEVQDNKQPPKPRPGPSQALPQGGVKPVKKVSSQLIP